jgi:hypothetical protein
MSGGHFDYDQYKIGYIADEVEQLIRKNGVKKDADEIKHESWRDPEWYEKYPEDLYHHKYSDETIKEFKKGLEYLRKAQIYTQRIDWLYCGDDGEDSFHERLAEDLKKLENE